jgi:hypothetical protein
LEHSRASIQQHQVIIDDENFRLVHGSQLSVVSAAQPARRYQGDSGPLESDPSASVLRLR